LVIAGGFGVDAGLPPVATCGEAELAWLGDVLTPVAVVPPAVRVGVTCLAGAAAW
jgi:hypothetical protein